MAAGSTGRRGRPGLGLVLFGGIVGAVAMAAYGDREALRGADERRARPLPLDRSPADHPAEIPLPGWKSIAWRTWEEIGRDRVLAVAAGVAFYGLLALVPAITAFVSLYGLFADRATAAEHLSLISNLLPTSAFELIGEQVTRLTEGDETKLGLGSIIGLGLALWSANAGMKALIDALNVAYNETETRGFVRLNATALTFTTGAIAFMLLAIGAIAVVPIVLKMLWLGAAGEWLLWLGRWPAILIVVLLGLAVLYRFAPDRRAPRWAWVTPGSLLASAAWLVVSLGFSWYVSGFGNYDATYGSLGAVIALLVWMWLSVIAILAGAELNSETERQAGERG